MGHASAEEVRAALESSFAGGVSIEVGDWYPELRRALERYAQGRYVDLRPFKIDLGPTTPYRRQVLEAARRIPYGKTMSYGELADESRRTSAAGPRRRDGLEWRRLCLSLPSAASWRPAERSADSLAGRAWSSSSGCSSWKPRALSGKSRGRAAGRPL